MSVSDHLESVESQEVTGGEVVLQGERGPREGRQGQHCRSHCRQGGNLHRSPLAGLSGVAEEVLDGEGFLLVF